MVAGNVRRTGGCHDAVANVSRETCRRVARRDPATMFHVERRASARVDESPGRRRSSTRCGWSRSTAVHSSVRSSRRLADQCHAGLVQQTIVRIAARRGDVARSCAPSPHRRRGGAARQTTATSSSSTVASVAACPTRSPLDAADRRGLPAARPSSPTGRAAARRSPRPGRPPPEPRSTSDRGPSRNEVHEPISVGDGIVQRSFTDRATSLDHRQRGDERAVVSHSPAR